jgi:hypothetical protein
MPNPPFKYSYAKNKPKTIDILSVSRQTEQKVDIKIENIVEEEFGKIFRKNMTSWDMYFNTLSSAKVLLSTAKEETYGYQIIDCFLYGNGCVPLAPNQFSYPEILLEDYLYDRHHIYGLIDKIHMVLDGRLKYKSYDVIEDLPPRNDEMFYEKLIYEMKNIKKNV